jgi:hypothetical protein
MSNPDSGGAIPVTIIPIPGHLTIASSCGCTSVTFFPDATTTLGQTIRLRIMKL